MKRALVGMRIIASIAAIVVVLWRVDGGDAADRMRQASLAWLALALAVSVGAVVLSTMLWRTLMAPPRPLFARLLTMYFSGLFYNNLGLGTIVGDASRVDAAVSAGVTPERAVVATAGERLISFAALLALSCAGAVALASEHRTIAIAVWLASAACVCLLALICSAAARRAALSRAPAVVRRALEDIADAVSELRTRPASLAAALLLALSVQACTVASTMIVLQSLGYEISPVEAVLAVPLIALCVLLPFSIQGIGVREATYVLFLGTSGVPAEVALSAAVLSYLVTLGVSLAGGLALAHAAVRSFASVRANAPACSLTRSVEEPSRRVA